MSLFVILTTLLHGLTASPAWAADTPLFKSEVGCERNFIYRNRTHSVDSSRKLDGEGLRTVLRKIPASEELLNNYQAKMRASAAPAYVTTLGLAMAIGGSIYGGKRETSLGRRDTTYGFLFSGIFVAIGGYAYGQYALRDKEKTLEKAIETYNDAVPEPERIRVQLLPASSGFGGEVRAEFPL